MSKSFTANPIANELKGSAWFKRPTEAPPEPSPEPASAPTPLPSQAIPQPEEQEKEATEASKLASKEDSMLASKKASKNASMLDIAPFTNDDLKALRQSTYNQLNVRGTEAEVEWLKDVAYQLSKEVRPGRVNQQDVIRVGMRLFQKLLDANKKELIRILEEIK